MTRQPVHAKTRGLLESPTHPGVNNYKSTALNELI
jgi:hypothetical protein